MAKDIGLSQSSIALWIRDGVIPDKHVDYLRDKLGAEFDECIDPESVVNEPPATYRKKPKGTPYYDIDVTAGDFSSIDAIIDRAPTEYYDIPGMRSDAIVNVFGDSMDAAIKSGDKIAISKITDNSFYNFGAIYVVVTKEQRLLKYLKAHPSDKHFLLVSENEFYDPIEIPRKKVLELWIVDQILRKARN